MGAIEFTDSLVEYLLGILIVFIFTKKLFNLKSAKLYFAVSGTVLFLMIASFLFLEGELQNGIVVNLEFWGLILTPFLLKGPKKFYIFSTAITLSSVIMFVAFYLVLVLSFFGQNITHSIFLEFTGMITSLIVSIVFFILCTVLKNQTKFFIENISKPVVLLFNLFLIIGGGHRLLRTAVLAHGDAAALDQIQISTTHFALDNRHFSFSFSFIPADGPSRPVVQIPPCAPMRTQST